MSLTDYNGNGLSAADIAAVTGNNNGFGFGNDGAWWILILFIFAAMNGGFGNGYGNNGVPFMMGQQSDVQRGFDQQAVMGGLNGITSAVSNGFANAEISRCNSQANILQTLSNNQAATTAAMNTLAMGLQNCCCENRAGIADLKYTIATENCADRAAMAANTQAILDKLCQQEIDAKNETISNLRTQLNMANLAASQTAQTGQILADNAMQTATLRQALNPTPIPAYMVQNPSCCNPVASFNGCGRGE